MLTNKPWLQQANQGLTLRSRLSESSDLPGIPVFCNFFHSIIVQNKRSSASLTADGNTFVGVLKCLHATVRALSRHHSTAWQWKPSLWGTVSRAQKQVCMGAQIWGRSCTKGSPEHRHLRHPEWKEMEVRILGSCCQYQGAHKIRGSFFYFK